MRGIPKKMTSRGQIVYKRLEREENRRGCFAPEAASLTPEPTLMMPTSLILP